MLVCDSRVYIIVPSLAWLHIEKAAIGTPAQSHTTQVNLEEIGCDKGAAVGPSQVVMRRLRRTDQLAMY